MDLEKQFLEAYENESDRIFRLCYFKTSDRDVALDLTQDTFAKTWQYLSRGKEVSNLRAFLFTVARNVIKDYYKKHKSLNFSDLSDIEIDIVTMTDSNAEINAEVSLVLRRLQEVPEKDRELIQLRYVEGMSVEEIAEIYNERANTISVRLHRATNRFRARLEKDNE